MTWGTFPAGGLTEAWIAGDAALECVEGTAQLPHAYKEGTDLHPHVHWSPLTANTGAASLRLDYTIAAIGGVFDAGHTLYNVSDSCVGGGVANAHLLCDLPDISGAGIIVSAVVHYKICRDGAGAGGTDSLTGTLALNSFDFHIQVDSVGSTSEFAK
jgi:hypothetical protein